MQEKKRFINIFSLISLILTLNLMIIQAQDRITGHSFATRSEVIAKNGMVATSHPMATQIGLDILKNGVYYGASESRKDGQAAGY